MIKLTDKRHIRQACKPADEVENLIAHPVNRCVENSYIKESKKTDEEIHLISVKNSTALSGKNTKRTFEPSSGGMGIRLNTASPTLHEM